MLAVLLARHEMWRDELQAWLLARDSAGLTDLWANTRYEGHPLTWHLLLFPLAHAGFGPAAMQVLHWLLAVGAASLIALTAPLPLWVRGAALFGYLPLYEYGAISRNYALTVLLIVAACAALAGRKTRFAGGAAALAACASPMGMLLAPALGVAIAGGRGERRHRVAAVALVAVGLVAAVLQVLPPPDYEHGRGWHLGWEPQRAAYVAWIHARALLPVVQPRLNFWETSVLFPSPIAGDGVSLFPTVLAGSVLAAALLGVAWLVRRSIPLLLAWAAGAGALLLFAYTKFPGATRHNGFLWVWLVAVLWLAVSSGVVTRRAATLVLAPTLLAGLVGAGIAATWDLRAPFSAAEAAARELRDRDLLGLPLVGGVDFATSGVAAFAPERRLYYPAIGRDGTFVVWNLERLRQNALASADLVEAARRCDRGRGAVLLTSSVIPAEARAGCSELFVVAPTIVPDESLWAYRCGGKR